MTTPPGPAGTSRVLTRDARFQQWQALLGNRRKRHRAGEMLVHGVRPITLAVEHGWAVRALLVADGRPLSRWARALLEQAGAPVHALADELLAELGEKDEEPPEVVAVVATPPDDLARLPIRPDLLVVLLDRPSSPGNLGSVVRSADALGAHGVVVTGHAADPYDPRAVRATTGSLFALPVVRVPEPATVLDWVAGVRAGGTAVSLVATDETGEPPIAAVDLTGPTVLLVGNETRGLSATWREAADVTTRIPMRGAASSLNLAAATTAVLYEASRQRDPVTAPVTGTSR